MAPGLSLKQRLAALASASSSPTTTTGQGSHRPEVLKRRGSLFGTPWTKPGGTEGVGGSTANEKVMQVMQSLIFQAGVDFETRPMVVLNASALPDPKEVSYDLLLSRILSYLNLYVESDYTVVWFAAGGRHTPGHSWLWKAYRSLSRKYRKNLKRMYIVHSTFFSKMLFSLAGAIISLKFFQKLEYISTLSELACHVPLTQIDIPPAVYQENLKHEMQINLPVLTHSDIFGVPLEDIMGFDGEKGGIPRVVKDSIQFLRETGLEEEGLFRRSPNSVMLKQVVQAYDRGNVVSLETFNDSHLAAVLIKKYLRDLPTPVFPESIYPLIRRCPPPTTDTDISTVSYIRDTLLSGLAPCVYILLSHILHLMHEVSLRSGSNRMDAHNLAVVLCPNLVHGSNPQKDVMLCMVPGGPTLHDSAPAPVAPVEGKTTLGMVIKHCIHRYYEVFDEVRDVSEAISPAEPLISTNTDSSSNLSSTSSSVSRDSNIHDEDEEIDDAMLVMSVGPSPSGSRQASSPPIPPSAWGIAHGQGGSTFKPRHRNTPSGGVRSMHTNAGAGEGSNGYASVSRARSMISVEKGTGNGGTSGTVGRNGSIAIGRGTSRKTAGAAVEAVGITASGFFSAPSSAPPVPTRTTGAEGLPH